jgi:FkbM family methyltransferase
MGSVRLVGYACNYLIRKYLLRQRYFVRKIHNYKLRLDIRDPGLSRAIAIRGSREEQLHHLLNGELGPGDVVVDLGANIGYYTIMMAKISGPNGRIYAMEPEPRNFEMLKANVAINRMSEQVQLFNCGADEHCGQATMYVSHQSNLHSLIPNPREIDNQERSASQTITIDVVDLTTFLDDKLVVNLIRMDIEGSEVAVLKGLIPAIDRGIFGGKIVFEAHFPKYQDGHNIRQPLEQLFARGYKVRALTSNDENSSRIKDYGYTPSTLTRTSDRVTQGIYLDIDNTDAITLICEIGGIRDVLLSKTIGPQRG